MKFKEVSKENIIKTGKKTEKFISVEKKITELTQLDFNLISSTENIESVIATYNNDLGTPIQGTFKFKLDLPLHLMSRYGYIRIHICSGLCGIMNQVLMKELHKMSDSHLINIYLQSGDQLRVSIFVDKIIQSKDIVFRMAKMKLTIKNKEDIECTIDGQIVKKNEYILLYTQFEQSKKSQIIYDYQIPCGCIFVIREILGDLKELNAFIDTKRIYKYGDIISVPMTAIDKKFSLIVDAYKIIHKVDDALLYNNSSSTQASCIKVKKYNNKKFIKKGKKE